MATNSEWKAPGLRGRCVSDDDADSLVWLTRERSVWPVIAQHLEFNPRSGALADADAPAGET